MLKPSVPLFRLEDTGMGEQMQEYAVSQVLHWFRRFDDYRIQQNSSHWQPLLNIIEDLSAFWAQDWADFTASLQAQRRRTGSVNRWHSVCKHGASRCVAESNPEELSAFLGQCRVLINLLPNTPETVGIINQQLLEKLPDGAYLLNLARGVHVVEDDLLAALDSGKVKGAMLDVFNREPLPPESPLWLHPRVAITPHVAAITRPAEAVVHFSHHCPARKRGEGLRASRPRTRLLIKHQVSCYRQRE